MADTIHLRGEGGSVFEFALPLHDDIQKAYDKGSLKRVTADGEPYVEHAEPAKLTPKEQLQADARALGVDDSGTVAEITERIEKRKALVEQARELELDESGSDDELRERIDTALAK